MNKTLLKNKKVGFEYFVEKEFEAGICLEGWEVKSLALGRGNLTDSYIKNINGELFIVGFNIQLLNNMKINELQTYDTTRFRKVLLHKKEILNLIKSVEIKGYTLMCNEIYFSGRKIKAKICLCKGKTKFDKRQTQKEKDLKMEAKRVLKSTPM